MHFCEKFKSLPVPTLEQTARFADHVADNHSWYKHLPFFPPGASFVFFPNPYAGWGVNAEGEQFAVYELERGNYFAHHSRLSTQDYVSQFGHWDYWVDDNPHQLNPQPGPWVYSTSDGQRELLPSDLKQKWSCRLTAFLKPAPPMFNIRPGDLEREANGFVAYARVHSGDPVVARYHSVAGELCQAAASCRGGASLLFMESESRAQRELLLETLHRVRSTWTEW